MVELVLEKEKLIDMLGEKFEKKIEITNLLVKTKNGEKIRFENLVIHGREKNTKFKKGT